MERRPLWAPWRVRYVTGPKGERCVFCAAAGGGDEELTVQRGKLASAIMNAFPYAPGHLLVFPNRHVGDPDQLGSEEVGELWALLCRLLRAARAALNPDGFNVGLNLGPVAGAGIPGHLHLHLVPRWEGDTNFMPVIADTAVISQALSDTAALLRRELGS